MAKVMISVPEELLDRIDARVAATAAASRSAWLAELAERELSRPAPEEMRAAVRRGRRVFARLGAFDSGAEIRKERDSRKW